MTLPIKPGQRLGHYRIERQIGQGGMGAVYLAEDTKLDRKVALKVLPPEVAADPGRLARFQREAKAVAALSHPNIVTIYSVEEEDGTHFLTMEMVEGGSLDREISPGGMPLVRVFEVGTALADALAAAHEKGIIHRDLKPANVIVTKDGRVKVLDFGLAKLARGTFEGGPTEVAPPTAGAELSTAATGMVSPGRSLTDAGLVVGTVPYMSPEQAGGEAVDARTDIFSLGVLLYEMTTGRRPFEGKNPAETISSILRDAPRPVSEARQDAPRHLGRIIDHCLQKEPEARFQTAKDIRNELRALRREVESRASAVTSHPSAVAGTFPEHPEASAPSSTPPAAPVSATSGPTAGASGSRPWIWMVAGAAIIIALGAALWFGPHRHDKAAPLRSTGSKPSGGGPAATAVTEAHSIAVLPFVNMSPDKNQEYFSDGISEELLNLLAKVPELWVAARTSSFSFKGKDAEIPEIAEKLHVAHVLEGSVRKSGNQVRITAQLIRASDGYDLWSKTYHRTLNDIFAMQDEIAADVVKQLKVTLLGDTPTVRKTDPEAYALYLQAVRIGGQGTAEAFVKADALLKKVLAIDPQYAPAWGHLAYNYFDEPAFGVLSSDEGLRLSRDAAAKVLGIDPDYAPAHALLGMIAMSYENDPAAAARHYERALALDPTHPSILADVGTLLQGLGRLQEALAARQFAVARDPVNATAITYLGITELYCGRFDEAIAQFRTALSLSPGRGSAHYSIGVALMLKGEPDAALAEMQQETVEGWRMIGLPMVYHALGRKADSDAALAELVRKYKKESAYNIAYVCAFRGEADRAFEWLDEAVRVSDSGLFDIQVENLFDNLHSDPRWLPFLRKIGRAPEQLAKIKFRATLPEDR